MRSNRGNRPALTSEPGDSVTKTDATNPTKESGDASIGTSGTDSASGTEETADQTTKDSGDETKDDSGAAPPPPAIDSTRSDDDLIAQFRSEAIERGYSDAASDGLALGRLRHLRSGGNGYSILSESDASDSVRNGETGSDETDSDDADHAAEGEVEKPDTARLKAPAGSTSLALHGAEYTVDETGHVEVPGAHVAHLLDLGFTFGDP